MTTTDSTMEKFALRFTLADATRAHDEWGANCGPGALAAVAGMSLAEVRQFMGEFEQKGYTNPTLMYESMARIGLKWFTLKPPDWPKFGLVRIQWEGPWTDAGVPLRARYRYTHWVAGARRNGSIGVFDINCMNSGGWVSLENWASVIVPHLTSQHKRASGRWHLTHALEITTTEEQR